MSDSEDFPQPMEIKTSVETRYQNSAHEEPEEPEEEKQDGKIINPVSLERDVSWINPAFVNEEKVHSTTDSDRDKISIMNSIKEGKGSEIVRVTSDEAYLASTETPPKKGVRFQQFVTTYEVSEESQESFDSRESGEDNGDAENEEKSFSLQQERRNLKKKNFLLRNKKQAKFLSVAAFQLPQELRIKESEIDDIVIKMIDPIKGIPIEKKKFLLTTYDNCSDGASICNWIREERKCDTDKAVQIAQTLLLNRGIMYSVSKKHSSFHPNSDNFYKFRAIDFKHSLPLNMFKIYHDNVGEDISKVSGELLNQAIELLKKFKKDNKIDFIRMRDNKEYARFALATAKLQRVKFDNANEGERAAFWLNVYNLMVLHSHMHYGTPTSTLQRKESLGRMYRIEDHNYTTEIVFNIIRGRKKDLPPDLRDLETSDISADKKFILCCFHGIDNTLPPRSFTGAGLRQETKETSKLYVEKFVEFKQAHDEIWLPRIFKELPELKNKEETLSLLHGLINTTQQKYIKNYSEAIDLKYRENTFDNIPYV